MTLTIIRKASKDRSWGIYRNDHLPFQTKSTKLMLVPKTTESAPLLMLMHPTPTNNNKAKNSQQFSIQGITLLVNHYSCAQQ